MANLTKLDNSNLWDKTFHILKKEIVERKFKPNQKISIPELSDIFGVSRTPIRDALSRLEKEGLVQTVSKVGTYVTPIDAKAAADIMDTRHMLESWSILNCMDGKGEAPEHLIAELKNILSRSAKDIGRLTLPKYLEQNYNYLFHMRMVAAGKNRKNMDIYVELMNYRYILFEASVIHYDMVVSAQEEHERIVQAIESGDAPAALTCVKLHLQASREALLEKIQAAGGYI
ncbi:GntR family transcriptional regulator [Paenibacillus sp. S150]|uniref:GntR family transcriptional regulator n=1 Tax=Paenibacillus sp. S150 TaxID=2749826 RepID=UPI001C56437C|nr:GntR family transcriptional regulator [Paenibacillus sp. S150]MBW4083387.1 GntR family transcriptional regulator [Paenibacillus sp. S150]